MLPFLGLEVTALSTRQRGLLGPLSAEQTPANSLEEGSQIAFPERLPAPAPEPLLLLLSLVTWLSISSLNQERGLLSGFLCHILSTTWSLALGRWQKYLSKA